MWSDYSMRREARPDEVPSIDIFVTQEIEKHVKALKPVLENGQDAEIKVA